MRKSARRLRAFCTLLVLFVAFAPPPAAEAEGASIADYKNDLIARGAKTLPMLARIEYRNAIIQLEKGDRKAGEKHLVQATRYDPHYPDPYFTLARLKILEFDVEATVYLSQAFGSLWKNFSFQALLVLNAFVVVPYVLILVSLIVCFAFAVKYFPFAAHKVSESLDKKFRSVLPGFSAYLLLLIPLILFPGVITALAYVTVVCWLFLYRREKFLMIALLLPFITLGLFGGYLKPLGSLADPKSLTSLIARANESAGDPQLIAQLQRTEVNGLEPERNLALGLVYQRSRAYPQAADYFFRAISAKPKDPMGYINLGNVHYLQGQYEKALEGYRKAEGIKPLDAVCQHGLAQAYIKTLLMKEASRSLQLASELGIEKIKASYAEIALPHILVYPKTFSNAQLWRTAFIEGRQSTADYLDETLMPLTRYPRKISAWILVAALLLCFVLARVVDPSKLTFQCSNCGRLTCENCCDTGREMNLCVRCAKTIENITSEKVIEALLRQKRQAALISRRKASRFMTVVLPGVRDISYGKVSRGFYLASLFSFAVVGLLSTGFVVTDPMFLVDSTPLWKIIVPLACMFFAYLASILAKHRYTFKAKRAARRGSREAKGDRPQASRVA